jgi:hypothetical protein
MPFICNNCKNKTHFKQDASGTCDYYETEYCDETGEVVDNYDTYYENHDNYESENFRCGECDSNDISDVDQEEWDNWEGPKPKTWKDKLNGDKNAINL